MNIVTILRKYSALLLGLIALVFSVSDAFSQVKVSSYSLTTFSSKFSSIKVDGVSTTFLAGADDGTAVAGSGGVINTTALPFSFLYDGTTYAVGSAVMFASNGFLVLGTNTGNAVPDGTRYGVADNVNNAIMPFSGDLVLYNGAGYYEVQGTSPNRVAIFEWSNFGIYPTYSSYNSQGMQVRLYETSNTIEFWYANPDYNFGGVKLAATGDPCLLWIGLQGNPFASDNKYFSSGTSAIPSSNLRFTFVIPLNIQLSTSPKTVDFGFGQAGQAVDKIVTVTHAGTEGTLNISSATITGTSDFTVVPPLPGPLSVGQSANITVRFTATVDGVRTATLTVVSNGKDSGAQSIFLKATGVAPNIAVDSNLLFKKTRTRLGDTLSQWIHITSVGAASLFFFSYPITGIDGDQYYISRFPANPIPPGQTDSMKISYVPTREGLRTATLTINSNASNAPAYVITLRGTGILPHIVVTPTPLLFDSTAEGDTVCKQISIWNPGTDTLKILANIVSSNDGDFHYTGLLGKDTLIPPDHTQTVTVCFVPKQQGIRQARIIFRTNIIKTFETPRRDTASLVSVDIRGTGLPLGVFSNSVSGLPFLDSAAVGKEVCREDTLRNTGDADIMVTGVTFASPNAGDFKQTGLTFPFLLKAHAMKIFNLCGTPSDKGLRTSMLTVTGTSGGRTITLPLPLGIYGINVCASPSPDALFLQTRVAKGMDSTVCDTVTNCGEIAAVYTATLVGTDKASYTVTPAASATIPPGGTTVFCVTFHSAAIAKTDASLLITAQDVADMTIPLSAEGTCASLTHSTPQVPNTGAGGKQTFTFTVDNTGTGDWTPGAGVFTGPGAGAYKIISIIPDPIPANGQGVVTIEFSPTDQISYVSNLTFPNSGPCQDVAITLDLSGLGVVNAVEPTASADGFILEQSYPNPSQGITNFTYTSPRETEVRISLVDLSGKLIRTLISGRVSEGMHTVNFDAKNMPSGTYVYVLKSGSTRLVRQLILTK